MSSTFEELLAFVAAHLTAPVTQEQAPDGSIYLTGGDPREVIVRLAASTVIVWEYAVRRGDGPPATDVVPIRVGSVVWRHVSDTHGMRIVNALIDAARESRLSKFRFCIFCETRKPPEWMQDDETCQSCVEKDQE